LDNICINKVSKEYNMKINIKKTKIMCISCQGTTKLGQVLMVNKYSKLISSNT